MIPHNLPPPVIVIPEVNPLANLIGEHPKLCLAGNVQKSSAQKKHHGVTTNELKQLKEEVWKRVTGLKKLLWIWEENPKYLRESVNYIIESNDKNRFFELITIVHSSKQQELKDALAVEFESNLQFTTAHFRELFLYPFSEDKIQNTLNLIATSEKLTNHFLDLMFSLGNDLPEVTRALQLGSKTVQEHLLQLAKNPHDLRGKVLQALNIRPDGKISITEKQLGLILGDALISESGLEGHSFVDAFDIVGSFGSAVGEELTKDLALMQRYLIAISKGIDFPFDNMAKTMKSQGRLAVPSGWSNPTGGHAMIAEAILEKNGTATVRLYNQGAGISNHNSKQEPFRERRGAYLEKRDIPANIVTSAAFWMILTGLRHPVQLNEPYSANDLYSWFVHCIPGTIVSSEHHILPQRSGSCAFKAILAYLKTKMSEDGYDRFILQFKFGILARYEEDLSFRKSNIGQSERRFLQEIRQKLRHSVQTQKAAGKLSDELAALLIHYCEVDVKITEDDTRCESRQLTSRFDKPHLTFTGNSTNIAIYNSTIETKSPLIYRELYQPVVFPQILRSLAEADKTYIHMQQIHKFLADFSFCNCLNAINLDPIFFTHLQNLIRVVNIHPINIAGLPNQLIVAWLTEFYLAAQEKLLSAELKEPITLGIAQNVHPLEIENSWLHSGNTLLNPLGERLLKEWQNRRLAAKSARPLFSYLSNGKNIIFQTEPACKEMILKEKSPAEIQEIEKKKGWSYAPFFNSRYPQLRRAIEVIEFAAEIEFGIRNAKRTFGYVQTDDVVGYSSPQNLGPSIYSQKIASISKASVCAPVVGIDLQLSMMEQDIEKIGLFKPEESWFAIKVASDSLGISPLTNQLKQPNAKVMLARIARFCERILNDHSDREDLCTSIFTLVSEINLRVPKTEALFLNLTQKHEGHLYWRYLLSLPEERVDPKEQLLAAYLLKIHTNHVQEASEINTNTSYFRHCSSIEYKLGYDAANLLWKQACGNKEIGANGAPYSNGLIQHKQPWHTTTFGSMLLKLFPEIEFSEWKMMKVRSSYIIARSWLCEKTGSCIIQGSEQLFANGIVLKKRLESLGMNFAKIENHDEYLYQLSSPSSIKGIPVSLCKDHMELWSENGLIIDPEQRQLYIVDGNSRLKITDCTTGAELLTGNVEYSPQLSFTWKGSSYRIPHFGNTRDNATIPVEVWARGKDTLWLNCMDGLLKFFVSNGEDGTLTYASLDYPGYFWDPDKTVSELGMLNGVLLTNGFDELFLLPEQQLEQNTVTVKREKWLTINTKHISIFKRTLHPDLSSNDYNQRLFSTANRSEYAYLIRELMLQRDWERARRYVDLVDSSNVTLLNLLLRPVWLQQPKADVLYLRIVCRTKKIFRDLETVYLKYIDRYPHLDHEWPLRIDEEQFLAGKIDPKGQNNLIQNHIKRVMNQPVKQQLVETQPIQMYSQSAMQGQKTPSPGASGPIGLQMLYRPQASPFSSFLEPCTLNARLIQAACCWFRYRNTSQAQKEEIGNFIRLNLQESALNSSPEEHIWPFFIETYEKFLQAKPTKTNEEIATLVREFVKQAPVGAPPPLAVSVPLSNRQQIRGAHFNSRVMTLDDVPSYVDKRISVVGKKFESQPLPKQLFSSLEPYFKDRATLIKQLKNTLAQTEAIHAHQLKELQPLFARPSPEHGSVGILELFTWLENLKSTNPAAELLIRVSQTTGELAILRTTLTALEKTDLSVQQLKRHLDCASLIEAEMDFKTRARLASFLWRRELALRPDQLRIITHTQNVKGLLGQADCGDGKTFAISPAISAISDDLIINIVPPGIFEEHARNVSMTFESNFGTLAFPLQLDRHDIWDRLEQLDDWMIRAKNSHTPIISTVADLSAAILAYHEILVTGNQVEHRTALEKIIAGFKKECTLLLDEVDAAAKEQVHWTMGNLIRVEPKRIDSFKEIYETLLAIDEAHDNSLFCLDGKKRFSRERYFKEGLQLIVDRLSLDHKEYLMAEFGTKEMQEAFEKLAPGLQDDLQMLRAELRVYLPHTLAMRFNVDYGPGSSENPLAVPYKAAHLADDKSRYTYVEIIANLTMQWMIRRVPGHEEIRYLIEQFIRSGSERAEYYAKRWIGPDAHIKELRAIVEKKGNWRQLVDQIQQNRLVRVDIGALGRLTKIELHSHMLQFTVATLERAMKCVIGLTATPYNSAGMDARMANNFLQSNACETTRQLLRTCAVKSYALLDEDTISRMAAPEGVHALMDPSAWLVDYQNSKIAEIILRGARTSIQQVVFWEPKCDKWQTLARRGYIEDYDPSKHVSNETFFHFDQARSRSSDMPLLDGCIAIALVGHDCTFTSLKQAMERCRLFKLGRQKVELWTEQASQCATGSDVEKLVMQNEKKQLKEELPLMAKRKMFEICREGLMEAIDKKTPGLECYRALLLQEVDHKSYIKHASLLPSPTLRADLEEYEHDLIKKYSKLLDNDKLKEIYDARKSCLEALDEQADTAFEPVLDMRVIAIHAKEQIKAEALDLKVQTQHVQKVKSQAYTEDGQDKQNTTTLWDAHKVLPILANRNIANDECVVIDAFQAMRIADLFKRLHAPQKLWVSSKIVTFATEPGMNRDHYKRMQSAAYILQVGLENILLTEQEADNVQRVFSTTRFENLQLYRLDGTNLNEETPPLSREIIECAALFNGRLGLLSKIEVNPDAVPSQLLYLKDRLAQFNDSDVRSFTNNPLVHLLQSKAL